MDTLNSDRTTGAQFLIETADFLKLAQVNSVPNSRGVFLDLIFSSNPDLAVGPAVDPLIPEEIAHPALECMLIDGQLLPKRQPIMVPNLNRCNTTRVFEWIQRQPYKIDDSLIDTEALFVKFCTDLKEIVIANCPYKSVETNSPFPGWFSRQLRECIIRKRRLHYRYRITLNKRYYQLFSECRSQCKRLLRQCHSSYIARVEESLATNPKTFWGHLRNLKKPSSTLDSLILNDRVAKEPQMMCELFSDFFSTVYKIPTAAIPCYSFHNNSHIATVYVTATEMERHLKSVDVSKGPGPDMIPSRVLKSCAEVLAPHLSLHFNSLLRQGVFPHNLKSGFLIPLHKSGARSEAKNYRPIVIQPVLAKIFEKIVLDRLTFTFKNLIIPEQHGFQRGRSTTTNLVDFTSRVLSAFSRSEQVDCVYLDFSKAFDRVGHLHLLEKLKAIGITGSLHAWFRSYLTGRTLRVKYESRLSRQTIEVLSGVPQGSHLGPFLFSMFVNDISENLSSQCLLFADDVKVFSEISCVRSQLELQRDLLRIQEWCEVNGMSLNPEKCVIMSYTRAQEILQFDYKLHDVTLQRVNKIRDLGVLLTSAMDFGEHINSIVSKATSILGFINRTCRSGFSANTIKVLYTALVRPVLEFSCIVWSPYQSGHISSLESVQRRFLRVVGAKLGYQYLEVDLHAMSSFLQIPPLSARRTVMDLVFLFKILNGLIDCPTILRRIDLHVPRRSARSTQLFAKHHYSTNYMYYSAIPRLMRAGNMFSSDIDFFGPSLLTFKKKASVVILRPIML